MELKDWNYKNIYASNQVTRYQDIVEKLFNELYYCYLKKLDEIKIKKQLSKSEKNLRDFINQRDEKNEVKRALIDYIAGQTDQYFINECIEHLTDIDIKQIFK